MSEVKRGEVYMADLNPVTGREQGGVRPVVIIQNNVGNKYSPTVIVAAITAQVKRSLPTHAKLFSNVLPKKSTALLEQIRTIDKSRLGDYLGELSSKEMDEITEALRISIDI